MPDKKCIDCRGKKRNVVTVTMLVIRIVRIERTGEKIGVR